MSELTLGGYMAKHDRAAAFGGSDGQAYSVAIYVDEEPDVRGLYGAALLFVRWSPAATGRSATSRPRRWPGAAREAEAAERLKTLSLYDVKAALDEAIARAPVGVVTALLGTVLERDGSVYRVATADGEIRAVLAGKAKRDTSAGRRGDRVRLEPDPEASCTPSSASSRGPPCSSGACRRAAAPGRWPPTWTRCSSSPPRSIPPPFLS